LLEHQTLADLAVIILTYNEAKHLARALMHVAPFAKEVFVVDSFSTDDTVEIAKAHGATVLQNRFVNQARQFQWALDHAPVTAKWVMRLDADEVIEPPLAVEIEAKLPNLSLDICGVNLKRKHIFLGRRIRHGGRYPLVLLRIWRTGKARVEDRWMDEHIILREGRQTTFDESFADHNLNDLSYFIEKHNGYATREAFEIVSLRFGLADSQDQLGSGATSRQATIKRFLKTRVYSRMPFELSSCMYFLYRYFIRLGFLDGREGLAYHFLQGFWYRFLVGAKVREIRSSLKGLGTADEIRDRLAVLTGLMPQDAYEALSRHASTRLAPLD
jgi:glycosyltransferase involved in cell wall biosynthesis